MVAVFEYAPDDVCTTTLPFDGQSEHMRILNRLAATRVPAPPLHLRTVHADGSQTLTTIIS